MRLRQRLKDTCLIVLADTLADLAGIVAELRLQAGAMPHQTSPSMRADSGEERAPGGTARRSRVADQNVAGKTGTAQVISREGRAAAARSDRDLRPHGWFAFFAPHDKPQIAGVIFTEHGDTGGTSAAIARHVIDTFFAKRQGRPLPVLDEQLLLRNTRAIASAAPAPPAGTAMPSAGGGGRP